MAPKEYPEKCRCSACSGPTRLAGRPGRNEDVSHPCSSLRPSERINHCVHLHGLTGAASRPPPPMGGREQLLFAAADAAAPSFRAGISRSVAERESLARTAGDTTARPLRAGLSRPVAEPASSARTKGDATNACTHLTRGLGGDAPIRNPVRGPRNVERTYGLFAVSERAANASLFAARRVQGNMRNAGVKKIGASYFEWPDF